MKTRLTAAGLPDRRIVHGSKSRVAAGCTCDVCKAAAPRHETARKRKNAAAQERKQVPTYGVGMTELGYIVLRCQQMSEDLTLPIRVRTRARYWYTKLTFADTASATPMVVESGGRRRSHNDRRQTANLLQWNGPYRPRIKEV